MNWLTEMEASERWCPFSRSLVVGHESVAGVNRTGNEGWALPLGTTCLGPRCAAWTWEPRTLNEVRRGRCGMLRV